MGHGSKLPAVVHWAQNCCTTWISIAQIAIAQIAIAQIATAQILTAQIVTAQIATTQIATTQITTAQIPSAQIAATQIATAQMVTAQIARQIILSDKLPPSGSKPDPLFNALIWRATDKVLAVISNLTKL